MDPTWQSDDGAASLRSPFPYFGGKSRVAATVWERFGDVAHFIEPFAGSLAVMLQRPHWPWDNTRVETVNDKNCFLANFWRALHSEPDAVAHYADWPINEADLYARHLWLVGTAYERIKRLRTEPEYYDAKVAGWWVWGLCQWIGRGWCAHPEPNPKLPDLSPGKGVHRPSQQCPHLGASRGVHRPSQCGLQEYFARLARRLRRVRVCCGEWTRVCGGKSGNSLAHIIHFGTAGIFLDPPYTAEAERNSNIYAVDDEEVGHAVRDWAVAHGDDRRLRIALCGYDGEYAIPDSWECVAWKAHGGYANLGDGRGRENCRRERIWFSPHCLRPTRDVPQFLPGFGDTNTENEQ